MKNLVVIPAYKPDEALISLAQRVRELGYELLTVDDGSGEAYEEIFEKEEISDGNKNKCRINRRYSRVKAKR